MNTNVAQSILLEQASIFDQLGLPFFLIQGTALGAHRDNGFVPNEKDIDFGFLQEDFTPKADRLAIALENTGYTVNRCARPFRQVRTIKTLKNGIRTDLVSYMKWKDKRFTHNTDPKTKPYAIVHDAILLENYQTANVFGRDFNVPAPIENIISPREYDDWKNTTRRQRITHPASTNSCNTTTSPSNSSTPPTSNAPHPSSDSTSSTPKTLLVVSIVLPVS